MNKFITEISSKEDYEEIIKNESKPIVVDFWATWCNPCRMFAPTLDEFASEYSDKVRVLKVDVDENEQLAYQLGIRSIPTVFVYKNGEVKEKSVGMLSKAELCEKVLKLL